MPVEVQAVWHRADKFSRKQAQQWCSDHDFKSDVYRARLDDGGLVTHHIHPQFDPAEGVEGSWRTLADDFPPGVSVTVCERQKSMDKQYAWSKLTVEKAIERDDIGYFEGVATTPSTDRVNDIVVSTGAKYNLPVQLLMHHDHHNPLGQVVEAKTTAGGIHIKAAIPLVTQRLRDAYAEIKAGVIGGLSIGFKPTKAEPIKGAKGYKFTEWDWHELSVVSVPCNADCTVTAVKSADIANTKSFGADPAKVFATDHGEIRGLVKPADPAIGATLAILNASLARIEKHLEREQ